MKINLIQAKIIFRNTEQVTTDSLEQLPATKNCSQQDVDAEENESMDLMFDESLSNNDSEMEEDAEVCSPNEKLHEQTITTSNETRFLAKLRLNNLII